VNFNAYRRLDAVNWSVLKAMLRSPAHYRWAVDHPDDGDTSSRRVLRAIHCAVLEPMQFAKLYWPYEGKRRGKAYIAARDAHPGQECLSPAEANHVGQVAKAVLESAVSGPIFAPGAGWSERTIEWIDSETGLRCKGRVDRTQDLGRTGPIQIWDLKTIGDVRESEVVWMARRLLWTGQLAHYRAGVRAATGRDCMAGLVVVEDGAPHDVGVYDISPRDLDDADILRHDLLRQVAECAASGVWPGACPERRTLVMSEKVNLEPIEEEEP
jgi:hypothetical protein